MIEIICHRGLWSNQTKQNSFAALKKANNEGFGVELDVRDKNSKIVISHDFYSVYSIALERYFEFISKNSHHDKCIAINIKSDGLGDELLKLINNYEIKNYFISRRCKKSS